jgi:hypothetical protein
LTDAGVAEEEAGRKKFVGIQVRSWRMRGVWRRRGNRARLG